MTPISPCSGYMEQIQEGFQQILETFMGCQTLTSLMEGRITTEHYKSILRHF